MTHIMLDLETWGKRPGCDIRSIGAVVFDPIGGTVGIECPTCLGGKRGTYGDGGNCTDCLNTGTDYRGEFYIATDNPLRYSSPQPNVSNQRKYSLYRDPETVKWWDDQSPEAQAAFANPIDLRQACEKFTSFICNVVPIARTGSFDDPPDDIKLWANDPHFDVSILDAVFHAVGLPVPWHYRAPRSMRTVTDLAGMSRDEYSNYGDAHNALHDAIAQAMTVCEAYKRLGLQK